MKEWRKADFAQKSQVESFLEEAVAANESVEQTSLAWLSSLPIPACVLARRDNLILPTASNQQFQDLTLNEGREAGLDLSYFSDLINRLHAEQRDTHFECWRSPDPVNLREFEINIGRFGNSGNYYLLTLVDRSAVAQSQVNLRREMMSDSLTGFFNRTGFEEEIEKRFDAPQDSKSDNSKFGILIIDLARFSRVNESMGALAGDELIITVARRLNSRVRAHEMLARLGGNEFALFVRMDEDSPALSKIAERLVEAFDEPCQLSNLEIKMECAVGAAIGDIGHDDANDVLRHAQLALKRAKASKKFELYTADVDARAKHRFSIETDLRRAIEANELDLHYQPLIDLEQGRISGFEALARWEHPEHGFISPMDFIPVAEESGLIVPLGRWALQQSAATLACWDERAGEQLDLRVSVNMSAVQMLHDDIPQAVQDAMDAANIDGGRLTLELTESAFVNDPDGAKRTLEALKALNVNLAMDDFGTGYSNLAYLQQLPIDVLKIDRSFVMDMIDNQDKTAIVRTILSLADTLGMRTTAEGIETAELSDALKQLGCTVGQGYFYAKPLKADEAFNYAVSTDKASPTS